MWQLVKEDHDGGNRASKVANDLLGAIAHGRDDSFRVIFFFTRQSI